MMFRLLTIFTLLIGFAAQARADIAPRPAPAGLKEITVFNRVRLGKAFDDYVFFVADGRDPGVPQYTYTKTTLSTKNSELMPSGGRDQYISLLAVPKASADQVPTLGTGRPDRSKIVGLCILSFNDTATVSRKHTGGFLTRTYTITGFGKDGYIEATVEHEPADVEGKRLNSRADAGSGKTRSVVAGIALALSFAVGGFLLVRKQRTFVVPTPD